MKWWKNAHSLLPIVTYLFSKVKCFVFDFVIFWFAYFVSFYNSKISLDRSDDSDSPVTLEVYPVWVASLSCRSKAANTNQSIKPGDKIWVTTMRKYALFYIISMGKIFA